MIHSVALQQFLRLLPGGRRLWAVPVAVLLAAVSSALYAQPVDTVDVRLTDTLPAYSRYRHWQDATYLWTVSGSGKIGQLAGAVKVEADARYVLPNQPFFFSGAKLPLNEDPTFALVCLASKEACRTYFAVNAVEQAGNPLMVLEDLVLERDADRLKKYRFLPDNDTYNPQHVYTRTVRGSDVFGQFMFIDRYGEQGYEVYYADNNDNNLPTTLRVVVERKSPELILTALNDKTIVLNDDDRSAVMRSRTVNVGTLSLEAVNNGASLIASQVVRNRGIDLLVLDGATVSGDVADFRIDYTDRSGAPVQPTLGLNRFTESDDLLRVDIRFVPRSTGPKELRLRLYCNDTTQNPDGSRRYFELVVQGTGTDARLSMTDTLDFGTVAIGDPPVVKTLVVTATGTTPADFNYTQPSVPFTQQEQGGGAPGPVSGLNTGQEHHTDITFAPVLAGNYIDSVVVGGGNTQRYVVYLKGRAELAEAVLAVDTLRLDQDTLFFGVTRKGIPLMKPFYVRNTGNVKLSILQEVVPHYSVTGAQDPPIHPTDLLEFRPAFSFFPENIDTLGGRWQAFMMRFDALNQYRPGQIEAKLSLSITVPDNSPEGYRIVAVDTFLLVARKLEARPEAVDRIGFDSVYVGNACPDSRTNWTITNRIEDDLQLTGQRAEIIHSNNGSVFTLNGVAYPQTLAQNETATLAVEYRPKHRGPDTVRYYVRYTSGTESDSIDVLLTGVGVQQELALDSAAEDNQSERLPVAGDTVELGDVRVGVPRSATVYFSNRGNLPFRMRPAGQVLKEVVYPENGFDFSTVVQPFPTATVGIGATARTTLRVVPTRAGYHLVRCEVASDIVTPERGIKCVPAEAAARVFYVRFNGIKPLPQTDVAAVDFDSVIYSPDCDRSRTLSVRVTNAGNTDLHVQPPVLVQGPPFRVLNADAFVLAPGATRAIMVEFTPPNTGVYRDTLLLQTDAGLPDSTLRIPVRAEAVKPQPVTLALPTVLSRPGRRIAVPLTIDRPALLSSLSSFATTLLYDASLLTYAGTYSTEGTAAQQAGTADVSVDAATPGQVTVSIDLPPGLSFSEHPTLIVLYFDTYLGQVPLTPLSLRDTEFGDGDCVGLLTVSPLGGAFGLDSVCNLGALVGPPATGLFRLEQNAPNPADAEAYVEFEVAFAADVYLYVYDSRGQRVAALAEGWHYPGTYRVPVPVHSLAPGLYFYQMQSGIFRSTKKMYIAK